MIAGISLLVGSAIYFFGVGIAGLIADQVKKELAKR
ncbi:MAG: hypothetical protein LDLANPLL_02715 [Turneriella sp.]|nr:hypothetical protein [Turneriella sp.]